jgi:uncharacterized protein (TIGR04255 family)
MSKLPNAPLLEVIFEIRWDIMKSGLQKYQFLHGDLYSLLKEYYPIREILVPANVPVELLLNSPVHRFRHKEKGYPLFQTGPGLISVNTDDEIYDWDKDYFIRCKTITESFFKVYPSLGNEIFTPSLIYIDFLKLNIEKEDAFQFVNENLNIKVSQSFFQNQILPKSLDFGFMYATDLGDLKFSLNIGKNSKGEDGIVMQTNLHGPGFDNSTNDIIGWLDKAHNLSTNLFKQMTEGKLYDSFK